MTQGSKARLETAKVNRDKWKTEYGNAVLAAHRDGLTYTEIARIVGVSEAAIRLMIKRYEEKR